MQTKCKIISLNVRKVRNEVKGRSIFAYLKDQKVKFCFLRETEANDKITWQN